MLKPNRIHIIGSVGSGKTTLASKLSKKYAIPHFELDNVVWKRTEYGDVRRSEEERNQQLINTVEQSEWIIEGVHHQWVTPSLIHSDIIIFLDTPYRIRVARITKRFVKQLLRIEKANYKPSWNMFLQMFKWNHQFEKLIKSEIIKSLKLYEGKLIILNKNQFDLEEYINAKNQRVGS